ncbi:3-oxoadipate enol-lactonase [Pseudovibrio sp. Tun.PSC04-5.I4]|uniref:bifunctional 3-oxoadipate enol-lactonase/4-carboxymuconolactone decarboxylase PcaDC n=1 Tax=Pseudovibrio sp. Tun.PSC04-5.I4 TaxID=1798213 RepID=UPI00088B7921|nr:3-oxoadipate enol-lactonase [Pseudovibrio sp. Tun.PSC04-5.I4]SDR48404.1 3-oxoadipate enol-lactonase / 4-carboxymuconolactone decarboxylase [Pseudovibrio sp. Tun.PSC04-5.I4]
MHFIELNTTTFHYKKTSSDSAAPALVLVNSLGTDFRIWDELLVHLGHQGEVLTYDKRGHGLSGTGTEPYSIELHVRDLAALMDAHGLQNAVICGLSVGGMIAMGLHAARPDLVGSLILCDTAPKIGDPQIWQERINAISQGGIDVVADAVMARWFSAGFQKTKPSALMGYRNMLTRTPVDGYIRTCEAIRDADLTSYASQIDVPVLCVVGEEDNSTPPELVEAMARLIPNARFEKVARSGHLPCIEQPEYLAHLVRQAIARTSPAAESCEQKTSEIYKQGMKTRRKVLGDSHVNKTELQKTSFDAPFQELITEAAWGHVWSRHNWTLRERSIVTIALLAALGHLDEVAMHVRAARNTGATREDISEALLHTAIYAGVPAANNAIKVVKTVFAQLDATGE